jgi:uncharacterized protein
MSQQNVEIVRKVLGAWNRREDESAVPLFHPGVVFDATRRRLNPKTYRGTAGIESMLTDRDEVWEEFRTEDAEFIDAGDRVVVVGRWVGTGKGSGIEIDQPSAEVVTVQDGRVVRWELYADRSAALEAAGLPK